MHDLLNRAKDEVAVALADESKTGAVTMNSLAPPASRLDGINVIARLVDKAKWETAAPVFQAVREWVEENWAEGRAMNPPEGLVSVNEGSGLPGEEQLDAPTAAKRLIVAASLYGAEAVAKCAVEFGSHGLIEVHTVYPMKGPPISREIRLDDYCSLIPYREGRRRISEAAEGPMLEGMRWPAEQDSNVCALACRSFERKGREGHRGEWYASPLMKFGPRVLELLLGLVWGNGLRLFGDWPFVPTLIGAALPYRYSLLNGRGGLGKVDLPLVGCGPESRQRPVPTEELAALMNSYGELPEQSRRVLDVAMRRLRDSTERASHEDRVIDMGIALEALFMEEGEEHDHRKRISGRGSWHYADSGKEREQTRSLLQSFYKLRGRIVHGRIPGEDEWSAADLGSVEDMLRASLKDMIREGRPATWERSRDVGAIRHDPVRTDSEIRSMKSDSLSWSVTEKREIDRALAAVRKAAMESAPTALEGRAGSLLMNATPEILARHRDQGIPYVVAHPALLYMAHPKWPQDRSDPLDGRTEYYCERDVVEHVQAWQKEVVRKGLDCVNVATDAALYHPRHREHWPFWPLPSG